MSLNRGETGGGELPARYFSRMRSLHRGTRFTSKRTRLSGAPVFLALALGAAAPMTPGTHNPVTFDEGSPLSSTAEIVRRTFSPLTAQHIREVASVAGQPLDIAREKFIVYVPTRKPPQGYALLVFVPPWGTATLPSGWASVLDDKGIVFASAAHSGNDTKVEFRRLPLAVIAAQQLMRDYAVAPSRVLVGGFSGGSRVALRIALAYPDVFRGALLNSESDPIGTVAIPLPPADLMRRFQDSSRLYYVTGEFDPGARNMQAASERNLPARLVRFRFPRHHHVAHRARNRRPAELVIGIGCSA